VLAIGVSCVDEAGSVGAGMTPISGLSQQDVCGDDMMFS
jgi:hypothetical protein